MRSEFEKAYEPNPHKSPFTEVRFNEEKQIYESLNQSLDRVARSLNAAWYGYRLRQTEVDELQKIVDAAKVLIEDLNKCYQQDHQNKFEYWRGFADSAGILGKRLEQVIRGGE